MKLILLSLILLYTGFSSVASAADIPQCNLKINGHTGIGSVIDVEQFRTAMRAKNIASVEFTKDFYNHRDETVDAKGTLFAYVDVYCEGVPDNNLAKADLKSLKWPCSVNGMAYRSSDATESKTGRTYNMYAEPTALINGDGVMKPDATGLDNRNYRGNRIAESQVEATARLTQMMIAFADEWVECK